MTFSLNSKKIKLFLIIPKEQNVNYMLYELYSLAFTEAIVVVGYSPRGTYWTVTKSVTISLTGEVWLSIVVAVVVFVVVIVVAVRLY